MSSPCTISREEKWDHSIENTLRKTSVGLVVGLVPSLLLTRSLAARLGVVMFTTGLGAGIGYGEASYLFNHNVLFDRRHIVSVQMFAPPTQTPASEKK